MMYKLGNSALCLLAAAFCACEEPGDASAPPVDMVYRASAVLLENTCDSDAPPAGEAWYIDVMPRADGSCSINLTGAWLFGETSLDSIPWRGGAISYRGSWSPYLDGGQYRSFLEGTITPMAAELTATTEETATDGQQCRRSLKLVGLPRRFSDPAAFEGHYKLDALAYGYGCEPNGSGKEAFRGSVIADIDPNRTWDGSQFKTTDGLYFDLGRTDVGQVNWSGSPVYSIGQSGYIREFRGNLSGKVGPNGTNLSLLVYGPDTPDGCGVPYFFKGRKILPDATAVDGEYRAEQKYYGQCFGETEDERTVVSVMSVAQEAGKIAVYRGIGRVVLDRDGVNISHVRKVSEDSSYTYSGRLTPPNLTLKISYDEESWFGSCHLVTEIEAIKRFIPAATE